MAEEDEIDILGDFSFDSCLAQNSQGIPSGSDRENTVHPQWLLDGTATNWYDFQNRAISSRSSEGPSRKLTGNRNVRTEHDVHTTWSHKERALLAREMAKYGRDVRKISQTLKTKTAAEIQALIEAEYGIHLDSPSFGLEKTNIDQDDIPSVVQEEIVTDNDNMNNVITMVTTASPTVKVRAPLRKKTNKPKNSLLKPEVLLDIKKTNELIAINPAEILYEDDLILGSTELVGNEMDAADIVSKKSLKSDSKLKPKVMKKIGNHRRKNSMNYDKSPRPRNSSKDKFRSPGRQRKDSGLSEESKSPKMQIVFSSGQAVPVSDGEQIIKIEKKKDSDPESDIDIDVDSGDDFAPAAPTASAALGGNEPPSEPPAKVEPPATMDFTPVPRRQKKINLDGDGGYTIMHTASGDLCARRGEPRAPKPVRVARAPPVALIPCRHYGAHRPAPYTVHLCVSTFILMDAHAHSSRAEVMGLLGGRLAGGGLAVSGYRAARAAADDTHCEMDPVSQSLACAALQSQGLLVCGWHHSHPHFSAWPSPRDAATQRGLQHAVERGGRPLMAAITAPPRDMMHTYSTYKCFRVEDDSDSEEDYSPYQLTVQLEADLTLETLPALLEELRGLKEAGAGEGRLSVDVARDVCPLAGRTYLEKCISSVSHHLVSAGYAADGDVIAQLQCGLRDVFR